MAEVWTRPAGRSSAVRSTHQGVVLVAEVDQPGVAGLPSSDRAEGQILQHELGINGFPNSKTACLNNRFQQGLDDAWSFLST
jgi:hypothetical protein